MSINLNLGDCLEAMRAMPDNSYELAIVDPPYGLGKRIYSGGTKGCKFHTLFGDNKWDDATPPKEYFIELFRVSAAQIIWGGNYFDLPPTRTVLCWDKKKGDNNFSMWEMAWTSFDKPAKIYKESSARDRIHPTQKPVKLYEWLLDNYAKEGDRILDTHLGSGSIALACHNRGFSLDAYEIDEEYYNAAKERLRVHQSQLTIF
jgi:site-specific DNA-methyltransferase (adenine-specific)